MNEEVPKLFCSERFGGVKSFLRQPSRKAGLGKIKNAHFSTSQGSHGARGFIPSGKLMILGFICNCFSKKFFWGVGALSQSGT